MLIALDWDGTFTADPVLWIAFVAMARRLGHQVHIVTMRHEDERVRLPGDMVVDAIHYTGRRAKRPYMQARGLTVQIWIDDMPEFVLMHAAPQSLEENARTGLWTPEAPC